MQELLELFKNRTAIIEMFQESWTWLTGVNNWDTWQGWITRGTIFIITTSVALGLIKKALEWTVAIKDAWKKAGLPLPMTASQGESIRRRKQFCKVIRSDLDTLNKAENWNDQLFTDLEAEVEAQGWYYASRLNALIKHKSFGLRRVRSLIQAIESSTEQALLLTGEPGSGKSVALRHLAHQLADRGTKSTDLKAKIPLYINLKELPPPPKTGPTADWIRSFVIDNVRRGDADTADYIREHWETHLHEGTWLFLFDSFDEIPEVMHAPAGSRALKNYAEAIRQFLATMSDCRGILASREFKGPEALPWQKFRILPLSEERQNELINNSFLPPLQKNIVRSHLATNSSALQKNPLYLALLCRYVKQENRSPINDHDLLARHIDRLAERDREYTKKKYNLTPNQLLEGAMTLAVLFAVDKNISLAPTHDQIANAISTKSPIHKRLDQLLAALVDVKIGRSDVPEARSGDRRFTFAHRRYQEVLFVRHLAINPDFLPPRVLLTNKDWREYAVAFLQTESTESIKPILADAAQLILHLAESHAPTQAINNLAFKANYHKWSDLEIHILNLLQEGLSRRTGDIPQSLIDATGHFLSLRWKDGDFIDRAMVILRGGLLPQPQLLEYLSFAIPFNVAFLQDAAFNSIVFLREAPPSLITWVREQLSEQALLCSTTEEQLRLHALAARAPTSIGADFILKRCNRLRKILKPIISLAHHYNRAFIRITLTQNRNPPASVTLSIVSILLLYLTIVPFGLMASETIPSLIPLTAFTALTSILVHFSYRALAGPQLIHFLNIQKENILVPLASFAGLATILAFPSTLAVLEKPATLLTLVAFALSIVLLLGFFLKHTHNKNKQIKRLHQQSAQPSPGHVVAAMAESPQELKTWLQQSRNTLLPTEHHARSLSRAIIQSIDGHNSVSTSRDVNQPFSERMGFLSQPNQTSRIIDITHSNLQRVPLHQETDPL